MSIVRVALPYGIRGRRPKRGLAVRGRRPRRPGRCDWIAFVGLARQLLDNMLAAIDLKRGRNVFITNIVKCRPPGNREPTPVEAQSCEPYLARQIELIRPRLIIALGKIAASNLLHTSASLASLRGKMHIYLDIPVIVTYHPAYLLRNLPGKAMVWEDLCFARKSMNQLLQSGH